MPTFNRLHGALATCVLVAASSAYADDDPTLTDGPKAECEQIPADCPSSTSSTTTSTQTETVTPAPAPQATPPPPMAMEEPQTEAPWYIRLGYGLSVGGGVDDFVGDAFRSTAHVGGGWTVRFTAGTRSWLALEAAYIGSAQSIDAIGLDNDAVLIGNGLQGGIRLNMLQGYYVQPFVYGAAAWRHYDLSNESFNTSDVNDSDDVFELPVGVGVAGYISGFMADVRAEYRGAWGNDLIPAFSGDDNGAIVGSMDRWGVTGNLGMEF